MRRYDIDWLRTLALGLLIIYHATIGFQSWAKEIFIIQNQQPLEALWPLMAMFNVWRIPILFVVSGMGVCFAMEHRTWKLLLKERTSRILVPFIFGFFCICPITTYIACLYYDIKPAYLPNPGHLWFLGNIFIYVLLLLPLLFYFQKRPQNAVSKIFTQCFRHPTGLYLVTLPFLVEAVLIQPEYFSLYVGTSHGFWLGLLCFLTGFILISLKDVFWCAVEGVRHLALTMAFGLYLVRLLFFGLESPAFVTAFESTNWIFAILGYGSIYLNKSSPILTYLSKAVYPVYIIHWPIQFALSYYLFPLSLPAPIKLLILLLTTLGLSFIAYELLIRHIAWIRPLFGMRRNA